MSKWATRCGLSTNQSTLFVEDFPYEKMLINFRGVFLQTHLLKMMNLPLGGMFLSYWRGQPKTHGDKRIGVLFFSDPFSGVFPRSFWGMVNPLVRRSSANFTDLNDTSSFGACCDEKTTCFWMSVFSYYIRIMMRFSMVVWFDIMVWQTLSERCQLGKKGTHHFPINLNIFGCQPFVFGATEKALWETDHSQRIQQNINVRKDSTEHSHEFSTTSFNKDSIHLPAFQISNEDISVI